MAFGFVVERFGILAVMLGRAMRVFQGEISFYIGILFVALSVIVSFLSIVQHRNVLRTLRPAEVPKGYRFWLAASANATVGLLGLVLIYYVFQGFRTGSTVGRTNHARARTGRLVAALPAQTAAQSAGGGKGLTRPWKREDAWLQVKV